MIEYFLFFFKFYINVQTAADVIHGKDIEVFSIGVGSAVNENETKYIATDVHNVFTLNNYDDLQHIQKAFNDKICSSKSSMQVIFHILFKIFVR